ncbi:MAG: peptidase sortase [Candidatus Taylorbacteria bacterium]|nr:peptidase sortase [Candidatus Taylorbacteria bacterium]
MKHKITLLLSLAALLLAGSYAAQAVFPLPLPEAAAADRSEARALEAETAAAKQRTVRQEVETRREAPKIAVTTNTQTQTAVSAKAPPAKIIETNESSGNANPVQIVIPAAGVNARILSVGLTSTGNMDTAKGWENVGWYKLGPMPGQAGSAVIAGHYETGPNGNGTSVPGVFEKLTSVKVGDDVYTIDGNGKRLRFVVTDTRVVDKNAATDTIFTSEGPARITLITCNGTWLPAQKTFSNRLIVTAVLN